jgi:hypothetical protein
LYLAQLVLLQGVDKTGVNRKSMRSTGVVTVMALALMLAATTVAAAEPDKPRLKFRSKALTCTCATGLSEAEISKAWEARFRQSEDAPLDNLDGRPATRDEQRRRVDEAQPE